MNTELKFRLTTRPTQDPNLPLPAETKIHETHQTHLLLGLHILSQDLKISNYIYLP